MSEYIFQEETITGLAEAFRLKTNTVDKLSIEDMKGFMSSMHYDPNGLIKYVTFMHGETELIKYPVIAGDTVKDPANAGLIEVPTKEPTNTMRYFFDGWSLADDNTTDADALANVTEDRTVYVTFREEEIITFAYSPLSRIEEISRSGHAEDFFSINDTRTVQIDGKDAIIEIIGFNHDALSDGTGKAGITVWCRNANKIVPQTKGNSATNRSWTTSSSFAPIKTIFDKFDPELADVVKTVTATAGESHKVFPPCAAAMGFTNNIYETVERYGKFTSKNDQGQGNTTPGYEDISLGYNFWCDNIRYSTSLPDYIRYDGKRYGSYSSTQAYPLFLFCI